MSTLSRPSEATQAPARPERRWWMVGLAVVAVIAAAHGGFWFGRSTAPPTAETDPLAAYAASPNTEWMPAIYGSGPDATFADASAVSITRDGQSVGNLATLTLVPGALSAINADPQALLREALTSDRDVGGQLAASAIDTSVVGSTLLACVHPFGIPECAWFGDDSLKVFMGTQLGDQFLLDYLGATRSIPTS